MFLAARTPSSELPAVTHLELNLEPGDARCDPYYIEVTILH